MTVLQERGAIDGSPKTPPKGTRNPVRALLSANFRAVELGQHFAKGSYEHQILLIHDVEVGKQHWPWFVIKLLKTGAGFAFEVRQKDAKGGVLNIWPENGPADKWGPYLRLDLSNMAKARDTYANLRTHMSSPDAARLETILWIARKAINSIPEAEVRKRVWWKQASGLLNNVFSEIGTPEASDPAASDRSGSSGQPGTQADPVIQGIRNGRLHGKIRPSLDGNRTVGCWVKSKLVGVVEATGQPNPLSENPELQFEIPLPPELRDGQPHGFKIGFLTAPPPSGTTYDLKFPLNLTSDPANPVAAPQSTWNQKEFGIIVFGHTRKDGILAILESLQRQGAIGITHVWLDGHQGKPALKKEIDDLTAEVAKFPVARIHSHRGHFGFRKSILQALSFMTNEYRSFALLEDDCFPTIHMAEVFRKELKLIENDDSIFSVYGHPFLMPSETDVCNRFQGWGWGTTSEKMKPFLRQLIECYSMPEANFLEFVQRVMTDDILKRIDVTHPRQPSHTLTKFFAWDETLCLLTALQGKVHKPTNPRTVFNFGVGGPSAHFDKIDWYRQPPFNMVAPDEIWDHFD